MNATDDKVQAVSEEGPDTVDDTPLSETDDQTTSDSPQGFIILSFLVGFIVMMLVGWVLFPKLLYSKKQQPIRYNHALHMEEVDDGCNSCHYFRDDGSFSGIPKNDRCIECHQDILGEDPEEIKYVQDYLDLDREVPWLVYSRQPDCVFFSHAAHVKMGKMACDTCHESREEMITTKVYEENRITGYSRDIWGKNIAGIGHNTRDRMKMDDCAECHERERPRKTSVQTGKDACFVCHK